MTQDDDFINSLPPLVRAEATALRDRPYRRFNTANTFNFGNALGGMLGANPVPPPAPRPAGAEPTGKPLVEDQKSVQAIVRLLALQQFVNRSLFSRLFLHLCNFDAPRKIVLDTIMTSLLQRNDKMDVEKRNFAPNSRSLAAEIKDADFTSSSMMLGYPAGFSYSVAMGGQPAYSFIARRTLELLFFLAKNNQKVTEHLTNKQENAECLLDQLIGLVSIPSFTGSLLDALLNLLSIIFKMKKAAENASLPTVAPSNIEKLVSLYSVEPSCSETAFKHLRMVVEQLGSSAENKSIIMEKIAAGAKKMAQLVEQDLEQLQKTLASNTVHPVVALMSPSTHHMISLLRQVKSASVILTPKNPAEPPEAVQTNAESLDKLMEMTGLWEKFENIMTSLSTGTVDNNTALVLSPILPMMEVFFITHAKPKDSEDTENQRFTEFAQRYRKFLNELVRQSPTLLEESFSALLTTPQLLDFENKRSYFKSQLEKEKTEDRGESIRLHVQRDQVMTSSYYGLHGRAPEEMKGKLTVVFNGEEGIDAGGVSREWYTILAKEMFNADYCLFTPTADSAYQPNKDSAINPDHLPYFKFVGRVIGKALYDGQLLDAHFTRSFYKHILSAPITYQDMEAIDPEYYRNLKWILDNPITDVLDLTFSYQTEEFGALKLEDLKPNGRNIPVTEDNKAEYVDLITQQKMTLSIKPQIDSFLKGFHEMIKPSLISIFTPAELELLISGLPDIDVDDLRKNTEYKGFTAHSPAVQWFWQVVNEMNQEDKALLLQFVTGTSKVPLGGFKALQGMNGLTKFSIHKSYESKRLPSAHTCFNQLDLPEYGTLEEMKRNILIAVRMGSEGFGFG